MNPLALFVFVSAAAHAALAQSVASCGGYGCVVPPVTCETAGTRYPVRGIARIGARLCVCHDVGGRGTWQCLPLPSFCNRTVTQTVTTVRPTTLTQTVTTVRPTTLTQTVTPTAPTPTAPTPTAPTPTAPTNCTATATATNCTATATATATVDPAQCKCVPAGNNYGRWATYSVSCPVTATRTIASTTTTATASAPSTVTAATNTGTTPTLPPVPPQPCCRVLSAACLACVANQTVAEYCAQKPATPGCDVGGYAEWWQ